MQKNSKCKLWGNGDKMPNQLVNIAIWLKNEKKTKHN